MKSPRFELNKISRLIRVQGLNYAFKRDILDDYGEPTNQASTFTIRGVFHAYTQHIQVVGADASSVKQKASPFILALYDDAKVLQQGDYVFIDGVKYLVSDITNYNNWGIAADISLEVCV